MDCHSCQPSLVDLLYGELAPDVADAARDHIGGCASCRAALERLQSGQRVAQQLELLEPPQKVSAHLLQLAEQHAGERVRERERAEALARRGAWAQWLERVRRFAMAPQVGMATIMLLIVAVGLWSVPELSRAPEVAGDTVANPDPEGEARATPGVRPAEPLDLEVDMRGRRIRTGDELAAEQTAPAGRYLDDTVELAEAEPMAEPAPASKAEADIDGELRADEVLAELQADAPADLDELSRRGESDVGAAAPSAPAAAPASREQKASASGARGGGAIGPDVADAFPGSRAREPARTARAKRQRAGGADERLMMPYRDESGRAGGPAAQTDERAPARPAPASPLQAAQQRLKSATTLQAKRKAHLDIARITRRQSGCAAALPHYQSAAAGGVRDATTGDALIELASCHRELGREAQARSLLEEAAKVPAVAARARRLLGDDAVMGGAAPASTEPASAPATAPAAAPRP